MHLAAAVSSKTGAVLPQTKFSQVLDQLESLLHMPPHVDLQPGQIPATARQPMQVRRQPAASPPPPSVSAALAPAASALVNPLQAPRTHSTAANTSRRRPHHVSKPMPVTAATPADLSKVLDQLDKVLHTPKKVVHSQPTSFAPRQHAVPSGPSRSRRWATRPPAKQVPTQPTTRSAVPLLQQISAAPDIHALSNLWTVHHDTIHVDHLTGMWMRLGQLFEAALPGKAHLDVSTQGSTDSDSGQQGTGTSFALPPPQSFQAALRAQLLHAALPRPLLNLWAKLLQSSSFEIPAADLRQLTHMLSVHSTLQQSLEQLLQSEAQVQARAVSNRLRQQAAADAVAEAAAAALGDDATPSRSSTPEELPLMQHRQPTTSSSPLLPQRTLPAHLSMACRAQFVDRALQATLVLLPTANSTQLLSVLAACSRLKHRLDAAWADAWWTASQPLLPTTPFPQLVAYLRYIGHLDLQPPPGWAAALLSATMPHLPNASMHELCSLVHGAARLRARPPPAWLAACVASCGARFDAFDAPAYGLVLHGLGRMRHRPPEGWLQEFWDSAASLLHDFTVQELSLLLRGAAYIKAPPEEHLQKDIWHHSTPRFRETASPTELANLGWAVLVALHLRPPRNWVAAWLSALSRRCAAAAASSRGGLPMPRGAARRAATALAVVGVADLPAWCDRLGVPLPNQEPRDPLAVPGASSRSPSEENDGSAVEGSSMSAETVSGSDGEDADIQLVDAVVMGEGPGSSSYEDEGQGIALEELWRGAPKGQGRGVGLRPLSPEVQSSQIEMVGMGVGGF